MNILLTGGGGYIGRIAADQLRRTGFQPVIYDRKQGRDIRKTAVLTRYLVQKKIAAVIHFAAYIQMGESMLNPKKYFDNNFLGSQSLLDAMTKAKVDKLIFSSTAGVYGNPRRLPIREDDPKRPENPYGASKLMVEELLQFYSRVYGLRSISLRYFNAAGADLNGTSGEDHRPESHLIPNVIRAGLHRRAFHLNGDDYPTRDGTCIRDYIHVLDLTQAHIISLKALLSGHQTDVYNTGTGSGYTNLEIIKAVAKTAGRKISIKIEPRRPGDAAELVADPAKFQTEFGWKPKYSDLETIITTAWNWHRRQLTERK